MPVCNMQSGRCSAPEHHALTCRASPTAPKPPEGATQASPVPFDMQAVPGAQPSCRHAWGSWKHLQWMSGHVKPPPGSFFTWVPMRPPAEGATHTSCSSCIAEGWAALPAATPTVPAISPYWLLRAEKRGWWAVSSAVASASDFRDSSWPAEGRSPQQQHRHMS